MSTALRDKLISLFEHTKQAHHQAFIETDGDDPDWPTWYAEHMQTKLASLLGVTFTQPDLTDLIKEMEARRQAEAADQDWPSFYADHLLEKFGK